jgi:hypothetical protein
MANEHHPLALRWLSFSEEDFAVATRIHKEFPRSDVWGYQQAAEKALKACFISLDLPFAKTHDLAPPTRTSPHHNRKALNAEPAKTRRTAQTG